MLTMSNHSAAYSADYTDDSSLAVLFVCYWLKMARIYARMIATQMIQLKPLWNRPH